MAAWYSSRPAAFDRNLRCYAASRGHASRPYSSSTVGFQIEMAIDEHSNALLQLNGASSASTKLIYRASYNDIFLVLEWKPLLSARY